MLQNPNPQPPFHFPVPSYIICCHNHGHGADMRGCSQSPVVPEGNPKNPEFKHQEITGPTVERDVTPLANETREVHVQFKLGLGGWISYMTQLLPIPESQYRVFWHLGYFIGVHDEARVEAEEVVSKCKLLHGRVSSTPWLCSPHFQTIFLQFFERVPACNYQRQLFKTPDGGTIALDWLRNVDVKKPSSEGSDGIPSDDKTPIVVVIPGLTSDSSSAYVKHLAFKMAKSGWNVVVSNHRGLGGVAITSDSLYNAGYTEDIRKIIDHLHTQYPQAPLFAVGTSIGANVLVKFLGEEGVDTPLVGAAAICSPWDLLIGDRFIKRRAAQRIYDRALGIGLKAYAQLHQSILPRLKDWESISKISCIRDYDKHVVCVLANYETVDTYYRKVSCGGYVAKVGIPLLCISALDDPVCTRETIPWDECRANKNVVLATTQHGGHLGHLEGMTAKSLWWVRAVDEYLCALNSSSLNCREKIQNTTVDSPLKSIDEAPYVNVMNGLVKRHQVK
ncbi:putative embryogenesis-associated protein EMB8-like [Capsicum annuum]|nr:putative embryogenesis-associated protein EMB8-like [Capsicum annuum]